MADNCLKKQRGGLGGRKDGKTILQLEPENLQSSGAVPKPLFASCVFFAQLIVLGVGGARYARMNLNLE